MVKHNNPILSSYAANLVCEHLDIPARVELVNDLLLNESDYGSKIGLYLAYRHQIEVNPSAVKPHLECLMDAERLEEKDYFHNTVKSLFNIDLTREFPIKDYFGNTTEVNHILRDIHMHREQGIEVFVVGAMNLLTVFAELASNDTQHIDTELKDLMDEVRGKCADLGSLKNGRQKDLAAKLGKTLGKHLRQIQIKKGLIMRNQVFIGYARADKDWLDLLLEHLQPIQDYHPTLDIWSDKKIETGDIWREEINNALARAKVAVLLVTRPFLKSRFIHFVEWPQILDAAQKKQLAVIWVPVSPCNVDATPIVQFQAAWRNIHCTLVDMKEGDRERHLVLVTKEIAKQVGIDLKL